MMQDYIVYGAKVSESKKERNQGKHLIQLWVAESKYSQIKMAADSVEEPVTSWCRRAIFQSLRKWTPPKADRSMFEPCPNCGKKHDPSEHFKDED